MDPNQLSQEKPSEADPDFDELEDAESDADEDPNVFRVRQPLEMPSAKIYTTQKLHSQSPPNHNSDFNLTILNSQRSHS